MKKSLLIILAFSLLPLIFNLEASNFSFRHYTVENGLATNNVSSIIQDRNGFIWIGTEGSLNRFDGNAFKEFSRTKNTKTIIWKNYITSLLEDKNGDIWIGADDGVYIYHPKTEQINRFSIKEDNVGITSIVNNMVEDATGNIWISTQEQGVFQFHMDTKKLEQYRIIVTGTSTYTFDKVIYVYADHNNRIWITSSNPPHSLLTFDRSKNCFRPFNLSNNPKISIYQIYQDSKGIFWLGTWDNGICKLNLKDNTITNYLSPETKNGISHIHEIYEYGENQLLIGSDDGLSLFNSQTGTHHLYTSSEIDPLSLSDKFVYPIIKDREGGLWIGTYFGGLNYVSPNSGFFERYTHSRYRNSVNGNVIGGFTEDNKGNIWIASDDGGLNCLNTKTGQFSNYLPQSGKNSISYHNVHALCIDNEQLWIGTYSGGLNILNTKTGKFKQYYSDSANPTTLDGGSIYAIFKDRTNRMWVGSMSGINLYNREKDNFTRIKQFGSTTIDIEQDLKGWIWFATQGSGVYRLNTQTNKWRHFTNIHTDSNSLPSNQVNCILLDKKSQLWLGTTNGLCKYNYDKEEFTTIELNIPNNSICSIIENNNDLWLTTANGLIRYNTINNNCQVFTRSDGLLSEQFLANSGFKSSEGKIYIGSASGFNVFHPKMLATNKLIPNTTITGFELFNKSVSVDSNGVLPRSIIYLDKIDLSHKDNVFSLGFSALSFVTPEKNKYAYKLEGFDRDWTYVNKQNKATYTNLPAGEYLFRVKAANNDGLWNEKDTTLKIIIHPPFWLNTGFKIFYFILILIGILLLLRASKKRTKKRHLEEIKEINQAKEKELYNSKIQFFTMIAHEIRTPVSLIIGPLEKIMNSVPTLPGHFLNDLNIIDRNSQRLLHLVNQLLDFRKVEQGALVMNFTQLNIYQLILAIFERFKPIIEQNNIEFTFLCPDKKLEATVDQEALTKIVSNLLTNALKFTQNQIILMCNYLPEEERFEIKVQDNGNGISDSEKEMIFKPFYQIPFGIKPGTGIGLSLVKSLAETHQGTVIVSDSPIKGATFTVSIPIKYSSEIDKNDSNQSEIQQNSTLTDTIDEALQTKTSKPILLIVEDNEDMREFLCNNFANDYEVHSANDGIEALEKLKTHEVNLIISDLMMPRMDGLDFCQKVRSNILLSHIPFVLLTAKTDIDSKIDGLNLGADSYIEKPFSITHLKATINNLIESRRLLREKYTDLPFVPITTIAGNSADEQFLTKVNEIIENNVSNVDFTIDILAEELCISRSGLFAKIKTLADITPNELIQLIRLKKAAELLLRKEYRVNEIAYMVGFNNPSYFTKCFQKQFGIRPLDFANKNAE